ADAWLPLDPRHRALAADKQQGDADSVLAFTRKLIAFRRASAALRQGAFKLNQADDALLAFERLHASERVLCLCNLGIAPHIVPTPEISALAFSVGDLGLNPAALRLGGYSAALVRI